MSKAIFIFTLLSTFLDRIKLAYVILLGLVVPIGMKLASLLNGVAESQTFEMLTGPVGVAFILTGLCLGVAGNTGTQSSKDGEYLPLIFTRPLPRWQYVMSKWVAVTLVGGSLAAFQNVLVAVMGSGFGESWPPLVVAGQIVERYLDAALIGAALLMTMLVRHWTMQVGAIVAFYVWLTGQTLPPVSVAGPQMSGVDATAIEGTRLMLDASKLIGDIILPTINIYDSVNAPYFPWLAVVSYLSAVVLYLALAVAVVNRRDFFYGTN